MQGLGCGKSLFAVLRREYPAARCFVGATLEIRKGLGVHLFVSASGKRKGGGTKDRDGDPIRAFGNDNPASWSNNRR